MKKVFYQFQKRTRIFGGFRQFLINPGGFLLAYVGCSERTGALFSLLFNVASVRFLIARHGEQLGGLVRSCGGVHWCGEEGGKMTTSAESFSASRRSGARLNWT